MPTDLNQNQIQTAQTIIKYGQKNGFTTDQINSAVKSAFLESSLGESKSTGIPGNIATGLFGYTNDQWNRSGIGGEKGKDSDQIRAFYNDIKNYTDRYNRLPPATKSGLSVDQYVYIKHHDGPNATDFTNESEGKSIWNGSKFTPPPEATAPNAPPSGSTIQSPMPSSGGQSPIQSPSSSNDETLADQTGGATLCRRWMRGLSSSGAETPIEQKHLYEKPPSGCSRTANQSDMVCRARSQALRTDGDASTGLCRETHDFRYSGQAKGLNQIPCSPAARN